MDVGNYISELVIAGGGLIAAFTAYQKGQDNGKSFHMESLIKAVEIWQNTGEKISLNFEKLQEEMDVLRVKHYDCEKMSKEQDDKIQKLVGRVDELKDALHNVIETPKDKRK